MDAVKFLKEVNRICETVDCPDCPLDNANLCINDTTVDGEEEKVCSIVEQWSKEHPIMTNRQKFREVFGENVCPTVEWWGEEYKVPNGEE